MGKRTGRFASADRMSVTNWRLAAAALATTSFPLLALLYVALFGAFGTVSPFLPSFFASRALSAPEISIVLTAGTLVRLTCGPLLGVAADAVGTRLVLFVASVGAGTLGLLYLPAAGLGPLLAISMVHALAISSLNPLADALALSASAREGGYPYGWVRGVGSASYLLGTLASGQLVAYAGLSSIIIASSLLFLAVPVAVVKLPPAAPVRRGETVNVRAALAAVLATPAFRGALLVAGLVIGSHAMSDTFAVIHWRAAGVGAGTVGFLLSEAVMSEIIVFVGVGPTLIRRLGPAGCAAVSAVAGVLRWAVFAQTTDATVLAVTELSHGLTFSLMHLACMEVIAVAIPRNLSGTAQTVYGTLCLGLASALVTLASGHTYAALGGHAFFLMSGLCLIALPLTPKLRL